MGNLTCKPKYTQDQEDAIRGYISLGLPDTRIAKLIGKGRMWVGRVRADANIPKARYCQTLESNEKRINTRVLETGGSSYRSSINSSRAASLGWPDYTINQALILNVLLTDGDMDSDKVIQMVALKRETNKWPGAIMAKNKLSDYASQLKRDGLLIVKGMGRNLGIYHLTSNAIKLYAERGTCKKYSLESLAKQENEYIPEA